MAASLQDIRPQHSHETIIKKLRNEAENNPAFHAVCLAFAVRLRTRQVISMENLMVTMAREGFDFQRSQYEKVLRTLALLGVGTVEFDSKKRVKALKNIRITLQSIGLAATGGVEKLENFTPEATFTKLPVEKVAVPSVPNTPVEQPKPMAFEAHLTVYFAEKPVTFKLPRNLTSDEISELLARLYRADV